MFVHLRIETTHTFKSLVVDRVSDRFSGSTDRGHLPVEATI